MLPAMTDDRQEIGLAGERIAEDWLVARGWTVLARRFRSGHRDLDLVVRQGRQVAFVEVKARRGAAYGSPIEAVGWRKRRELARSASVWIDRHGQGGDAYRFDVIGVLLTGGSAQVEHVEHAFDVPPRA